MDNPLINPLDATGDHFRQDVTPNTKALTAFVGELISRSVKATMVHGENMDYLRGI